MQRAVHLDKQFTVTGYTMDPARTRLLMVFHKKLGRWVPPGGHIDANEFPSDAVLREVREETGVIATHPPHVYLDLGLPSDSDTEAQIPSPLTMSAQVIAANSRDPEHIHIDMMFELVADPADLLDPQRAEVADVRWFTRAEVLAEEFTFDAVRSFARQRMNG